MAHDKYARLPLYTAVRVVSSTRSHRRCVPLSFFGHTETQLVVHTHRFADVDKTVAIPVALTTPWHSFGCSTTLMGCAMICSSYIIVCWQRCVIVTVATANIDYSSDDRQCSVEEKCSRVPQSVCVADRFWGTHDILFWGLGARVAIAGECDAQ